jgi:flagellar basal body-associated protein FliL
MQSIKHLLARSEKKDGMDSTMVGLLVSLLVIVLLGFVLVGALFFLRRLRRAKQQAELPLYEKRQSGHRRLTITATPFRKGRESIPVYQEKQDLMANSSSPPTSPVPEIRITFPDEVDESGRPQSGRVVVVRVGDHSVGLEPLKEELPPYQRDASDRFDSLDLDRIGGLKEKDDKYYS